ncbi:hypothetical protein WI67_19125 [Burkholderia cepacia]|nr:hypothetical protein WI67_19125 [Burkholderia cepacia]
MQRRLVYILRTARCFCSTYPRYPHLSRKRRTAAQTSNRIDLARERFETAIAVFLEHRSYAATITLAEAAELVLGQAQRRTV